MTRVLVVVFDALRPEFLIPEAMPNLCAFARAGVRYTSARSTFPTETRVNQSAVVTGCRPVAHGVVGNRFVAPELAGDRLINTGNDRQLARAFAAGPVLLAPSLGERLAAAGRTYASISAGTPGGGFLINHAAEQTGGFRLAMRAPERAAPAGVFARIVERIGRPPEHALPATRWIGWAVDAYLGFVEPEIAPDVMLLWLCEPDESFHALGIGSAGSVQAIHHADALFGRILETHRAAIEAGEMQIIAMSDHGQITLEGAPLALPDRLTEAGFPASAERMGAGDCVIGVDSAGGIWVRDRDADLAARIAEWLLRQPWCGPLFTREGLAGTLRTAEVGIDHARGPDISLVLRSHAGPNAEGMPGMTAHDASYPVGGGCHGGLNRHELATVLALGGRAFRAGAEIAVPAGTTDITPTVLALLGLPGDGMDGRALAEAFRDGPDPAGVEWQTRELVSAGTPRTRLSFSEVGRTRYLNDAVAE